MYDFLNNIFSLLLNSIKDRKNISVNNEKTESKISSAKWHDNGVMCCAKNTEGEECSQLYDYGN